MQTVACPGPAADYGPPAWLYHRCYRARGFFSIYMTLAGVLSLVLLASLPRLLPGAALPRWPTLPWLVPLAGLLATYTRGAWMGFAAGVLALLPMTRKGRWLLLGGLIVLALAALAGPQQLRARFLTMGRALVVGSLAAIVGFLVAGLSEYNFGDSEVVMVAWALMALPWVADAKEASPAPLRYNRSST